MSTFKPAYVTLLEKGIFPERIKEAYAHLTQCDVCAHACGIDRLAGEVGICRTGERAMVSSYGPHLGEEDPLRGRHGSGTIFFTRCNLHCQFCQNHDISQTDSGHEIESAELAVIMLDLQDRGCHNINFVSPSHVVHQILSAVWVAAEAGLTIPLVYNSGGYDSLSSLGLLEGVIDIYMPDMKYADPEIGVQLSKIPNYPCINQTAVKEMHRQVGDLAVDQDHIATRGLLVRHLVLPENLAGTDQIVHFLAKDISTQTYLNLMDQYRPSYHAQRYPEINRPITRQEYNTAIQWAHEAGLTRLDKRRGIHF